MIARIGGEEFAILLPDSESEQAVRVANRIRTAIPESQTASLGVARWNGGESADEFVARADAALYRAKAAGRDRVVLVA